MIVHLEGAAQALGVGVHWGRPGVCAPAPDVVALEALSQACLEPTAVVGQQDLGRLRRPREYLIPGRLGGTGGLPGMAKAQAKASAGSMKVRMGHRMPPGRA